MADKPKGPASYFPAIESRYGRSIADWQDALRASGFTSHKEQVEWLKSAHNFGHGHASALVNYHLNPGKWPEYVPSE